MDETGFDLGSHQSTQVLAISEKALRGGYKRAKAAKVGAAHQDWVTVIETCCAESQALPPLVIFKGKAHFHDKWLPENVNTQGYKWYARNKGWTANFTGIQWLQKVFQPKNIAVDPNHR